ncbi:MAG: hypothetical protein JWP00_1956 [Chloroflexi bacterium]|nr:hypothetical protein [Chloroflexota bacterium]
MNTPQENFPYTTPPDRPEQIKQALREQDLPAAAVQELVPVLLRLDEWQAPQPTPADTRRLLNRLSNHLPRRSPVREALLNQRAHPYNRLFWLLLIARQQVGILRVSFWLLSALVTCLGAVLVLNSEADTSQVVILRLGGPLLAYLGTISAFRSSEQGVFEFELACPPSLSQLTLARLSVVLGYDIGLGLLLSGTLSAWGGENFLAVTLHWLMPLLLVIGLALLLSLRLPTLLAASIAYGSWLAFLGGVTLSERLGLGSLRLNTNGEIALGLAGLALLALALLNIKKALPVVLPRH